MQSGNIIVSPCSGTITRIQRGNIRIFLSDVDDHTIYSACTGRIAKIIEEEGSWKRKVFQAFQEKNARLHITMDNGVSYWIEVGYVYILFFNKCRYPRYSITDKLRFDYKKGDLVKAGQPVGEILFGSLAEIQIPLTDFKLNKTLVQSKEKIVGGQSPLAFNKKIGRKLTEQQYGEISGFLKKIQEEPFEEIEKRNKRSDGNTKKKSFKKRRLV